jgi:3-phenylpropionate/cinnamic acid dioxygenase small subunit
VIAEVADLLYQEAELLDAGRYDDWLVLLAPDLRYWAPSRADLSRAVEEAGEADRLALFDENRDSLVLRIKRLATGLAWSEIPPTRTRRLIGNVRCEAGSGERLQVRSNFLVWRSRSPGGESILAGARHDVWSRSPQWQLHERKIVLDQRTVENLSLLL